MRLRNDILRGLRVGLLLLAGVLVAFTVNWLRPRAEAPRASSPEPARQPTATPVPLQAPLPNPASSQSEVPPPPPRAGEVHRVKRRAPEQSEPALAAKITPVEDDDLQESSEKTQAAESPTEPEVSAEHAAEASDAAAPAAAQDTPAKTENRPKRWVKAVGHFLHITRPSQQQQ